VMMLALSQEEEPPPALDPRPASERPAPLAPPGLWRRLLAMVSGRRPA
jgi:hypothetical protein